MGTSAIVRTLFPLRDQISNRLVRIEPGAKQFLEPGTAPVAKKRLQRGHVAGNAFDERCQLRPDNRRNKQDQVDKRQNNDGDDEQGCRKAVDSKTLKAIRERREQIGDREPGDKRQKNFAQQPQRQHKKHQDDQPEKDLTFDHRPLKRRFAAETRHSARGHGFATVEFMWRTHSAT